MTIPKAYRELMGRQVPVGSLTVQVPDDIPRDDDQVIEHEELIAEIERAIASPKGIVDLGKRLQKGLRAGIEEHMRSRLEGEAS